MADIRNVHTREIAAPHSEVERLDLWLDLTNRPARAS